MNNKEISEILSQRIFNFQRDDKSEINQYRRKRIQEAISWDAGESTENPKKKIVEQMKSGEEVFFLKPGKEVDNSTPNPHDMTPRVGSIYTDYTFDDMWSVISRGSVVDFEKFKFLLVLIYRNAYFVDHEEVSPGKIRYKPDEEVSSCIDEIDESLSEVIPGGVRELLHFLDILGWNEDVKYQAKRTDYDLKTNFYTGRMNNILTSVKIPYRLALFVKHVLDNKNSPEGIDFSEGLDTMQNLTNARGVAKPTQSELEEWFGPTLYK